MRIAPHRIAATLFAAALGVAACAGSDDEATSTTDTEAPGTTEQTEQTEQQFPDVIDAAARFDGDTWSFDVTVSSPYDTPERYADGWRVVGPDGTEYGFRLLTHDHASEQPFTRSLAGVEIPDDVDVVTIEGRDQANGYGGETFELTLLR